MADAVLTFAFFMFKYSLMSAVVCFEGLWRYLDEESRVKDLELAL